MKQLFRRIRHMYNIFKNAQKTINIKTPFIDFSFAPSIIPAL